MRPKEGKDIGDEPRADELIGLFEEVVLSRENVVRRRAENK